MTIKLALLLCSLPALPVLLVLSRTARFSVHDGPPTRADRTISTLIILAVAGMLAFMAALVVATG